MEETKTEEKPEEEKPKEPSYLERIQKTKEEIQGLLAMADKAVNELRELKTEEILSGRTEAGKPPEAKAEVTPQEYAAKALRGEIVK